MNRRLFRLGVGLILALGACLARPGFGAPATQPTQVASVVQPGATKLDPAKLREMGLQSALSGRFADGLKELRAASAAAPDDRIASESVRLLEAFLKQWDQGAGERAAEYQRAVERIAHAGIAQAFVEKADPAEIKAIRKGIEKVIEAYNRSGTADGLDEAQGRKEARDLKAQSLKALGESAEAAAAVALTVKDRPGPYADVFRATAEQAARLLADYRRAWDGLKVDDGNAWRMGTGRLKDLEYDVTDVLAEMESVAVEKPWRSALMQARLARRLAEDKDKFAREPWFRELAGEMEARGRKFIGEAKWYDALSVYASLNDLLPDNEDYQKTLKIVERHVRVLGLYGKKPKPTTRSSSPASEPASKPAARTPLRPSEGLEDDGDSSTPPAEEEPHWRELFANVDADMVEKVIQQIDLSYVASVDYRKVARGALTGVKVLAETPQAADTFEGLKDQGKRKEFLEAVDRLLADVEKRDHPGHLDLILALNGVLRASEQTVNLPTEVLAVEFTDGLLDEMDKFSSMVWPSEVADFDKQTMGHFCGVGIQIAKEPDEPLKVVTPLVGTPAFKAGIKAGDLVVKVDGKPTQGLSIDKLVTSIMGPKDTKVVLTIKRGGRVKDYQITREEIHIRTIKGWAQDSRTGEWDYRLDANSGVGYIRITQFTNQTAEHLADVLKSLHGSGVRAIVLDLRFNPGGLLSAAANVADEFLISGRIVSTRGRRTRQSEINATPSGQYLDGDLVVLVNQYSASAAEIVSGALKDWRRAKIVGERTYGKGSVQNVIPIRRHNAKLKLTAAYYYLPHGRLLHRANGAKDWGVDPDVEVLLSPRQTRRWLDIRRKTDVLQEVDPKLLAGDLARQYDADLQLDTAVLLLKLMRLQQKASAA